MIKNTILAKKDFYNKNKEKLPKEIIENIEKNFDVEFTYDSTTIEGNTLTLMETKMILEDKISIGGKKLREIYEVINNNNAFAYVKKCIKEQEYLDEIKIKDIHEILMQNIIQGGIYRNTDVRIVGANHKPSSPVKMYDELQFFYNDLNSKKEELDIIELSAWTHAEFVKIHPFIDGNGRTSRIIMNYQLMKGGYLPINIKTEDRFEYYKYLDVYAVTGDLEPFKKFIENLEEKRLDEVNNIIKDYISNQNNI